MEEQKTKNSQGSRKIQKAPVQWFIRICFIWLIHIIAFVLGGLLLGSNKILEIVVGIMVLLMVFGFLFLLAKGDADKDYSHLISNKRKFMNTAPLNEKLLQFSYYKGVCVPALAVLPVLIMYIIALSAKITFFRGIVTIFYIGSALILDGFAIYDSTAVLAGKNMTVYAVVYSICLVLTVASYAAGYALKGYKRTVMHEKIQREQKQKTKDW